MVTITLISDSEPLDGSNPEDIDGDLPVVQEEQADESPSPKRSRTSGWKAPLDHPSSEFRLALPGSFLETFLRSAPILLKKWLHRDWKFPRVPLSTPVSENARNPNMF